MIIIIIIVIICYAGGRGPARARGGAVAAHKRTVTPRAPQAFHAVFRACVVVARACVTQDLASAATARGGVGGTSTRLHATVARLAASIPDAPVGEHAALRAAMRVADTGLREVRAVVAAVSGRSQNRAAARLRTADTARHSAG